MCVIEEKEGIFVFVRHRSLFTWEKIYQQSCGLVLASRRAEFENADLHFSSCMNE
jgi:hypothetical protein